MTTPAVQAMLANGGINLAAAILVLVVGWLVARWVSRLARKGLDRFPHFDPTLKPLVATLLRYAVFALALISVLNQFGVQTTSIIALLGAAGIAIGLALQGTLSNVASGVMLLLLRPLRVGEHVGLGDAVGRVREIGLFRTIMIMDDGRYVSVPNSAIFSGSVTNDSREPTRKVNFKVTLDMSADIFEAQQTMLAVVERDPRVMKVPAPSVTVDSLAEFTFVMLVQAWVENADFGTAQSDLQFEIRRLFETAPVAAPQRLVGVTAKARGTLSSPARSEARSH
ncbi:MAG TPA: mechanosensitive ion channel domain-containing protein [Rhizomicrobium sp.]